MLAALPGVAAGLGGADSSSALVSEASCAAEAATDAAAASLAATCGYDVIITDALTEWATSYVRPDGAVVLETSARAVRQDSDGDGRWAPVAVEVLATPVAAGEVEGVPAGMLPVTGGVEPMWLNPGGDAGADLPLAMIGHPDERVSMHSESLPVTADAALSDDRVSYDFGDGVSLTVDVNTDGTIVTPVVRVEDRAALDHL
ncbi:hypothetical protein [Isoptericola sediminis]|uniref:hypothetical protein n=1 Tax=Isoptericola sediminis TaxID=2733572 RepID=UPI001487ACF8|nr:hypothetical protein [Isoptericola sediminis]